MAIDNTTVALLASIKRRGFIPSGSGLSDSDILQYASEELRSYIPAFLKGIREEFIVSTLDIAVSDGVVSAPARAVGAALRTIGWLASDGKVKFLDRVEPENAGGWGSDTGEPRGYMFQGNDVILFPAPTSGTIRLAYQQRPGQLVLTTDCGLVASNAGPIITVDAVPSAWEIGTLVDVVSSVPNFVATALDQEITALSTTTVTFAALPSGLVEGSYLCGAGETCIPQLPTEVHDLLAQAAAYKIAQATGSKRADDIKAGLTDLRAQMTVILSPRADGSARPVISKSRIGRWNVGW